jgi:hypothetical protein
MDERDDLDRLLEQAAPAAPEELPGRTLRRLAVARRSGRLLLAIMAEVVALAALAALAGLVGRAATSAGAVDLLRIAAEDRSLVAAEPSSFGLALIQTAPWRAVLALALDVLAVVVLTGYLLNAATLSAAGTGARR